jgi:hypothetical protein
MTREAPTSMPPRLAGVPAFPAVAMKLLSLLADKSCNFSRVADASPDPALSGD